MSQLVKHVNDGEVERFLGELEKEHVGRPRLIFAMDATASRQPTWDRACHVQGQMFVEAARLGGLDVQLVYYRGHDECRASRWVSDAGALVGLMTGVACRAGHTQIARTLSHAAKEAGREPVAALVFIGDACEEQPATIESTAVKLAAQGVKCFLFQEGSSEHVTLVLGRIIHHTGGALLSFDESSPRLLGELLGAVAAYAAGGGRALQDLSGRSDGARLLLKHMH